MLPEPQGEPAVPAVANLLELPGDVLVPCLQLLSPKDVCSFRAASRRCKSLADSPCIWQELCRANGVTSLHGWNVDTYRDLYRTLLHKFGSLPGVWSGSTPSVGSLLLVEVSPPTLHASSVIPQRLNGAFCKGAVFTITLLGPGQLSIKCCRPGRVRPHEPSGQFDFGALPTCAHHPGFLNFRGRECFSFHCVNACQQDVLELHSRLMAAVSVHTAGHNFPEITPELRELQILQYIINHQALWLPAPQAPQGDEVTIFHRLRIPRGRHPMEGLWKGTFGGHGVEIVTFEAVDTQAGQELWARKVTGDPNVPHSQLTFRVFFHCPINENGERIAHPQREHDFRIPSDHAVDVNVRSCPALVVQGRYRAEGQVARVRFRDPKWVPLQVMIFEGGMVGVSWTTLATFSLFVPLDISVPALVPQSATRGATN
ncbi:hypothetical protein WJX73_004578 [Symbiochloris irregularis]|uniref:F-box domain-containing protein n=1 Tax=Symbiochloris irregularis TaxID=706552 RepID=A0AAW1PZ55_9CHLO